MKKFLPRTSKNTSGFTLVELLVVISIIAILSVIGVTLFGGVQKRARDTIRRNDIDSIKKALEQRFDAEAGQYPGPLQTSWFANGVTPVDPTSNSTYSGVPTGSVASFSICATMENDSSVVCVYNQQQ